jgi:formate dehydrogenase iron-sulfur subunit
MSLGILTDLTRCIGCGACALACKQANHLPGDVDEALTATTWTRVDEVRGVHVRRQCMHCVEPACVSVCPVGALEKRPQGPVTYDEDKCIGCRYCMIGCPFSVPRYEWSERAPRVQKCLMCFEALTSRGEPPACTTACPTGATVAGERDELLREAHRRIAAEPERYVDHVYGEHEAGGTSVLYLSPVPFEELGFAQLSSAAPYPRLTWNVLSRLPGVVSVAGVGLLGLWWIIGRRDALARERLAPTDDDHGGRS